MSFGMKGIIIGVTVLGAVECLALSEEEYLRLIEKEAEGLAEPSEPMLPDRAPKGNGRKKAGELTHREFEAMLERKQKGTYSIYKSLLEKDKAEVYKAFSSGASMWTVRRMIIDRKMHR